MFFPEGQIRVHLYGYPTDMRKSFDGLYALTREGLQSYPLNGVWAKRLESGRFISNWRAVQSREMDWTGLKLLLEGIEAGPTTQAISVCRTCARACTIFGACDRLCTC